MCSICVPEYKFKIITRVQGITVIQQEITRGEGHCTGSLLDNNY